MAAWQRVRIPIPPGYKPDDRREIADAIVEMIRDRTALGVGVKKRGGSFQNYDFPEYTPEYIKFKGSKKVDLRLSDEMMDELGVISVSTDSVLVGFEAGTDVNAKAEGNQIGSYGRDPNPRKARRFLGITKEELDAILAPYPDPQASEEE